MELSFEHTHDDGSDAGFVRCLDCPGTPIVNPELHDYWHRTGRPAIQGLLDGEIAEPIDEGRE